ncbi:uncharacterized protein LOC103574780 isoform X1 [Microplitis demolitor]|uniref:uncharacterized protein LOC103574780 isoform X1 n=1 Tax=Microplitis demolitor TaxID=69319 RepID=UPI0004CDB874|nr:uncharacterized protein LOC103574780 isoform X1 [Microplitis demolitor]
MDDEDGEASNNDSWTIPEQLSYKETKLTDELKRFNSANQCAMDIYDNKDDSDDRLSNQVAYRGFKKNILAQTQENKVRKDTGGLVTSQNSIKDKKITEYAQYLGLQPAGKYKCLKCHPTVTFKSLSMLKQHEFICQAANSTSSLPGTSDQPSQSLSTQRQSFFTSTSSSSSSSSSSRSTSTRKLSKNNNFRITRKVYLCAACGTYFENWNLFLHMREIHKRHICLFCLGMFGQAERLSNHLTKKHSVTEFKFNSIDDFYEIFKGSCYLLCCDCEKVFSETDDFSEHYCAGNGNNNDNANLNANDGVAINIGTSAAGASSNAGDNRVNTNVVQSSQPQQPISEQVCSMCRQANGKHLATCKLGQTYDKRHDTSLMHERLISDNKRTLLPNPANKVAKKLLNAGKARFKTTDKALLSYQRKLADLYARKRSRIAQEEEENEDIQGNYEINYNKFSGKIDDKRTDSQKERQVVEIDVSKSPVHERTDRYTDTIMQVSRCSDDWDTDEDKHDDEEDDDDDDDDDRVNSLDEPLDEMEQGELILDDGKEDSIESLPSPIRETSPRLQIASSPVREPSPIEQIPDVSDTTENVSGSTEEESIVKESAPPPVPVTTSTSITTSTPTATASVTRVNSTNRSLVIKICTNKNSQFSIATPNSNGTYTNNNDSVNDEEENEDEAESAEEINKSGEIDSDKEVTDSDHASDSDSGKLTVALPNESHQPEEEPIVSQEPAQLHQEEETKETEDLAKPDEPYREITPMPSPVKESVPESDGILLANSELPCIDLNVVGLLESMEIDDLLKRCIEAASPTCVYCNHARHIAINGKQLALHMLAEHRFQPQHPAIIIQYEQFINRVKKSLDEIESLYFNFDSYDSKRGTYDVPAQRTYECYLCRIYYTIHKDLYLHNRKMHQKTILVCIMCKSTFYNHSELLCHLCPGVYAAGVTIRYRCCLCNIESLPSAFRLMVHLRKRHHACDVCLESTGNQQKLSNHVWKHKLHHLCYRCGIAYRNKPDITKHLFWKHGTESVVCKKCLQKKWPHVYHFCIPPSEFICEECGAKFTRAVALKVHKRLHTGDAPYGCSECLERFISKKLLAKHEDTHKPQPEIPPAPPENTEMQVDVCEPNTDVPSENLAEPKADTTTAAVADDVSKVPKEPVRKVVDVYDLPPLNLSSDSDSDSEEDKKEKEKQVNKCEDKSKDEEKNKEKNEDESKEIDETSRIETNEVPEEIQLAEVNDNRDEETDEVDKQEVVIMNGIWDNFKSYAASLGASDVLVTPEIDIKTSNDEILKNIAAEHDYWVVYEPPKDETIQEPENATKSEEVTESSTLTTNGESDKKKKSPKKKKQSGGSSSSSDSSSDSDSSSCSCGTNCSCSSSSSGSSSSSSSSSDSDSSASENSPRKQSAATRKDRRKERDARRKIKEDAAAEVQPENGIRSCDDAPIEPVAVTEVQENNTPVALPLRESDLETTETETDEDFYDEYPQQHANRLLAERRNQSMLQESSVVAPASADDSMAFGSSSSDVKNGTIESSIPDVNSLPSAPSLVKSIKPTAKRKIKTKRRKKLEGRESIRESIVRESGRGRGRGRPPGTTKAAMEALKLNIPKNILYHKKSISPPTFNTIDEFMYHTNYHQVNTDTSGIINSSAISATSENENTSANDSKRSSKRKRIPKRFYGDSSDEEQQRQASSTTTTTTTTTKWRKTDSIPYIPSITIKQNFGPPPSSVVEQKVYSTVPSVQEPVSVPPSQPGLITQPAVVPQSVSVHTAVTAGTTDSDEPADTSSDSSASECESTVNQRVTHPPLPLNNSGPTGPSNRPANVYCYCRCPYDEVSEMIACDGSNCHIEWFHFECVGIMVPPKGKWYCPDCLKKEGIPDNQFN